VSYIVLRVDYLMVFSRGLEVFGYSGGEGLFDNGSQ